MAKLTMELGDQTVASLDSLRQLTGRSSRVDVVRDALLLYEYFVERARRQEFVFVGPDRASAAEVVALPFQYAKQMGASSTQPAGVTEPSSDTRMKDIKYSQTSDSNRS